MPARSAQEAVDALGVALGLPVVLEDADQQPLAHSPHVGISDPMRDATILQRASGPEVLAHFDRFDVRSRDEAFVVPGDDAIGVLARLCVPLRDEGALLGFVWALLPDGAATPEQLRTAAAAVPELVAALRDERHLDVEEAAIVGGLVSDEGERRAAAQAELRRRGVRDVGPWLAVAVVGSALGDPVARRRLRATSLAPRGAIQLRSVGEREAIVVLAGTGDVDAVGDLARRARAAIVGPGGAGPGAHAGADPGADPETDRGADPAAGALVALGVGDAHEEPSVLVGSLVQARAAARWAAVATPTTVGSNGGVAAWRDLGVGRVLTQLTDGQVEAAVDPRVRRLVASDVELARTLECYLDVAASAADAAAALHVHRATLYQRLERIAGAGIDVRRGEDRTAAHVAFAALRLVGSWPR